MSDRTRTENGASSSTVVMTDIAEPSTSPMPAVRLKLRKPKAKKSVAWTPDTVDNENMNKKKSKCCCVYQKPKEFDESSSESDSECEHCQGHVEKRKKAPHPENTPPQPSADGEK